MGVAGHDAQHTSRKKESLVQVSKPLKKSTCFARISDSWSTKEVQHPIDYSTMQRQPRWHLKCRMQCKCNPKREKGVRERERERWRERERKGETLIFVKAEYVTSVVGRGGGRASANAVLGTDAAVGLGTYVSSRAVCTA